MKTRMTVFLFLGLFVVLFLGVSLGAVWQFAVPSSEWVRVGPVADFPPAEAPYPLRHGEIGLIYIVNIRGDILVLFARDPHLVGQTVNWAPFANRFIDPSTGSHYWLDGSFDTRFMPNGPEPMDLERFPVKVEGGLIWIDRSGIGR